MADDDGSLQMLPPGQRKAPTPTPTPTPTPVAPDPLQMLPPGQRPAPTAPAAAPAAPLQMLPPGQRQGATPADTGPGWGIDWSKGGQVTMPQSAQDWSTIAARNSLMGLYGSPSKADVDAARARLSPDAAASADAAGAAISPSSLLNLVPRLGPALAGGLHEGLLSYNNGPGGWQGAKTALEDAGAGAGWSAGGQFLGAAAPKILPELARQSVAVAGAGLAAKTGINEALEHHLMGWLPVEDLYKQGLGMLGTYGFGAGTAGTMAKNAVEKVSDAAPTRQAIVSLMQGLGSAFRQQAGPYDQWMTGN
jgi:hypothetical protein